MIPVPDTDTMRDTKKVSGWLLFALMSPLLVLAILCTYTLFLMTPPSDFPIGQEFVVTPGASVEEIGDRLAREGFVRSSTLFYASIVLEYDATAIQAGTYTFEDSLDVRALTRHIAVNGPEHKLLTLTLPEGITVAEIGRIADEKLPRFDLARYNALTAEREGYLFPETYFVPDDFSAEELVALLLDTSEEALLTRKEQIQSHNLSEYEILILASIIEREANTEESMRRVSGILQNRLEIGMPLQADASIEYILDKPLSELTPADLEIDSPYNTYNHNGLPPTPIGNPGAQAIDAVLDPQISDYFYYITDEDGIFHYARTFDEHRQNIARYLR